MTLIITQRTQQVLLPTANRICSAIFVHHMSIKLTAFFPSLFKHLYKLTVFPLRHKLFLVFLWREPRQNDLFCPLSDRRLSSAYFTHKILSKTLTPAHTRACTHITVVQFLQLTLSILFLFFIAHSFCTLITAITENHSNTVHCQRERGKRSPLVRCTEKQLKNVNEGLLKFSHSQTVEHQHKQRARYSQALIYRQDQEDRQREREKQRDNTQIWPPIHTSTWPQDCRNLWDSRGGEPLWGVHCMVNELLRHIWSDAKWSDLLGQLHWGVLHSRHTSITDRD